MRISTHTKTVTLKIVYCGPGRAGKTTNLKRLHEATDPTRRGGLVQLETEQERTLFFDWFPVQLGQVRGLRLRVHFFSVPGQSFYDFTRRAVLEGADGVVFVADSAANRENANQVALRDLYTHLDDLGLLDIPVVFQWNKRDLPDALPEAILARALNPGGRPAVSASAFSGEGVQLTQALIVQEVVRRLREGQPGGRRAAK